MPVGRERERNLTSKHKYGANQYTHTHTHTHTTPVISSPGKLIIYTDYWLIQNARRLHYTMYKKNFVHPL